ncbi:hypothetical protein [Streptomyces sp. NPDC088789]|uniref:hypothetical protein n=1 Tax=Streptomyces sp. NPDC088789 TaxID=3365899 RepID=UPI0037FA1B62
MNEHADQQHTVQVNPGYGYGQLARALETARTHPDADTRRRAEEKGRTWRSVLAGMADGRLLIGSRTPVTGLPAWVTPEMVRGGFATGEPCAGGPLQRYEAEAARRVGVPEERAALFAHCLTEDGLAHLGALLDSGRYEVTVPEEAALLTVAWLARAEQVDAALDLVAELAPFAERLRFTPRPSTRPAPDAGSVHRSTVGQASRAFAARRPNPAVESQREALTVWAPFADEMLAHWLETAHDDRPVLTRAPDEDWLRRGAALLTRYRALAARHTYCTKHLKPRENLGILRRALEETVAGRVLEPRLRGLLRSAVAGMVARRGVPGSAGHSALRHAQAVQAALPSHHALAGLLRQRLDGLPQDQGVPEVEPLLAPVTQEEALRARVPAGATIPASLRKPLESALSAPLATLVERGVVPSAEVLAELVPQLVAATTARAYPDAALRTLAAANYRAFRNRRSLLLLHLERQVRAEELPWVRAVADERERRGASAGEVSAQALRQLAELAVQAFPGTILPNPLVRELSVLAGAADLGAPLVEELAADIFMGTFSPKFMTAARLAAEQLSGTLYERYYAIDYRTVRNLAIEEAATSRTTRKREGYGYRTSPGFARLCRERAEACSLGSLAPRPADAAKDAPKRRLRADHWSTAGNGMIVEQAQILTTHNLAALTTRAGVAPPAGWPDLARRAFTTVCRLTARLEGNPRPLSTIKDTAYAWRQMIYYLSLSTDQDLRSTLTWLTSESHRHAPHVTHRLAPALTGLHQCVKGRGPDEGEGRSLLGWSTNGHWLREGRRSGS